MSLLLMVVLRNILHITYKIMCNVYVPDTDVHTNASQCNDDIVFTGMLFPFLIIQLQAPIVYNWPDHQLKISILPD